jgi:hypothetical protein
LGMNGYICEMECGTKNCEYEIMSR